MDSIIRDFENYFEIKLATDPAAILESQRLRYQVYCVEHPFLDRTRYSTGLEWDEFDRRSVHSILIHRPSGCVSATVRIIVADPYDSTAIFPLEEFEALRRHERDNVWRVSRNTLGEISRFAVSKQFRRRAREADLSHGIVLEEQRELIESGRRLIPHITLGLFKAIVQMSVANNVGYWYAVMEPTLIRLLERFGIHFTAIGPLVDYHGLRQPCVSAASQVLAGIHHRQPEIWEFITDGGTLSVPDTANVA